MAFFVREIPSPTTQHSHSVHRQETSKSDVTDIVKDHITGVWGSQGLFFVATNEGRSLWVTNSFPRSQWIECETIEGPKLEIVAVIPNPNNTSQVYIVHKNSTTACIELNPHTNHWQKKQQFQLSNAKGAKVLSVVLHPYTSNFFWCEKRSAAPGLSSCCVCMREVEELWQESVAIYVGPVVAILHSCPVVDLHLLHKGICMIPVIPGEDGQLLLFWTSVPREIKAFVWNHGVVDNLTKSDFRSVMMAILPVWHDQTDQVHLVSVTSHPTTMELILIDSHFAVYYAVINNGIPHMKLLCTLSSSESLKADRISQSFSVGLFIGLLLDSGKVTMFDVKSGSAICDICDLNSNKLGLWTAIGDVPRIGFWMPNKIWQLVSKPVVDIANLIQSSKIDSTTRGVLAQHKQTAKGFNASNERKNVTKELMNLDNGKYASCESIQEAKTGEMIASCKCSSTAQHVVLSQETDLPHCFVCRKQRKSYHSGQLSAAADNISLEGSSCLDSNASIRFLKAWKFEHHAAKIALNIAMSNELIGEGHVIGQDVLDLLLSDSFQTPVLAIGLLWNNPMYRSFVQEHLKAFLRKLDSEETSMRTPVLEILLPKFKQFGFLCQTFEELFQEHFSSTMVNEMKDSESVKRQTEELLETMDLANPSDVDLAHLGLLKSHNLADFQEGVAEFTGLRTPEGGLHIGLEQRWRWLYRLEWRDGQWVKSHKAQEDPHNAFLSLLCHVVYSAEPDWLMNIRGQGLRVVSVPATDEQAGNYITQSVTDCLPILKLSPSPKSAQVHATLLWSAGQELQALQVLLRHQAWHQAVDFYSLCPSETEFTISLFTMLLKALIREGASSHLINKALSLAPKRLSTYEMLAILKDSRRRQDEPLVLRASALTIGDLRGHLEKLLNS
ncbi:uncharacterized protein LOC116603961 [Nematostella vectensis]|uniref:uncharacterized protein LOC116603961 n=1 Tax=Nematostella vectensis TaxID=45351 RepID=UPI002076E76F|nr:uncharacterized protein LOC116603961 [Nematostella vectensis]